MVPCLSKHFIKRSNFVASTSISSTVCLLSYWVWSLSSTTRNVHFYDQNANDESEIIIEDRFLRQIFPFRHRSVVMIRQPFLSMMKSGIITKKS